MGSVKVWIPDGFYTDIFTGQKYDGSQMLTLSRDLYTIPVLAREGAVIPLSGDSGNSSSNPEILEVWVYKGDNIFTIYEDNGKTDFNQHTAETVFTNSYDRAEGRIALNIKVQGDTSVISENRIYRIHFKDAVCSGVKASGGRAKVTYDGRGCPVCEIGLSDKPMELILNGVTTPAAESRNEKIIKIMSRWQSGTFKKNAVYQAFGATDDVNSLFRLLHRSRLPKAVFDALYESLSQIDD